MLVAAIASSAASQEDAQADDPFRAHIVPILLRHCVHCHNASDHKGGLDVTSWKTLHAGGDSGAVVVPRRSAESLLWQYVADDEMPPKDLRLSGAEKSQLRSWIDAGAHWSGSPINLLELTTDARAGYDWWSLQPIVRPVPPVVQDASWPINDVDRFVLARLESQGIRPSEQADIRTLTRRVSFDLIGLPPTPKEVEALEAASHHNAQAAFRGLVDQLLDSPHFGERWARHWLDVIRYGESQGFERNWLRPLAWRYRDWVIHAFNSDMPYDEFIRLQIAGDVLSPQDPAGAIATGCLTCGPWDMASARNGSDIMKRMAREAELEEQIGTLGQAFMGLTLHCARCHDHKFDPVSMQDYYQVAAAIGGVWRGHRTMEPVRSAVDEATRDERRILEGGIRSLRGEMAALDAGLREQVHQAALREARETVTQLTKTLKAEQRTRDVSQARLEKTADEQKRLEVKSKIRSAERNILRTQLKLDGAEEYLERLSREIAALPYGEILRQLPEQMREAYSCLVLKSSRLELRYEILTARVAHSVVPREPGVCHVLARGDFRQPQQPVAAHGIDAIRGPNGDFGLSPQAPEAMRRVKLAGWIADPRNPLTARVIVNRLWHYHFGKGLVDTPNDFGFNGGRPSHPKLLDWLADELTENGWSLKHIHRLIVTSRTYQQTSVAINSKAEQVDADNRLLWRMDARRLEGEAIRDAMLAVSGELNPQMGGPGYRDFEIKSTGMDDHFLSTGFDTQQTHRRTIYRTWARSANNSLLDALDCPDPSVTAPRRTVTTTPVQALALLNSPFSLGRAEQFSRRLRRESGESVAGQIRQAYRLALARLPSSDERQAAARFVGRYGLARFCLMFFNANEFVYVD